MAVIVQGTPTQIANGSTYTAETTGTNRAVVFVVQTFNSGNDYTVSSLSFGAQAATKVVESNPSGLKGTSSVWYILDANIPTGSQVVTPTLSGGSISDCSIHCYTLSSVDQTTPTSGSDSGTSTGFLSTVSFTSLATSNNGLGVGGACFLGFNNRTWSPPSGWTEDTDGGLTSISACSDHIATTGSTLSGTFNLDTARNGTRLCAVASFAEVAATGGVTVDCTTDALTLTENTSSIAYDVNVNTTSDTLTLTTNTADISYGININTTGDVLLISEGQASVSLDVAVNTISSGLLLIENTANVVYDINVNTFTDSLSVTTNTASVTYDINVNAINTALSLVGGNADIKYDVSVNANTASLILTEGSAEVITGNLVETTADNLSLVANTANIIFDSVINTTASSLVLTENKAQIITGAVVSRELGGHVISSWEKGKMSKQLRILLMEEDKKVMEYIKQMVNNYY